MMKQGYKRGSEAFPLTDLNEQIAIRRYIDSGYADYLCSCHGKAGFHKHPQPPRRRGKDNRNSIFDTVNGIDWNHHEPLNAQAREFMEAP